LSEGIKIESILKTARETLGLFLPDITFILDIDPLQAQERLKKRRLETGEYTNWDNLNLEFHRKIRNYYLELRKYFPERVYVIDAHRSENEILIEVEEIIHQLISPSQSLPEFVRAFIFNKKNELLLVKDKK
jgi:dTMP kinase